MIFRKTYLKEQQDAFRFQIKLAVKNDLPIVIHCRESFDEIFKILEEENCDKLRGVFHCFTGNIDQAKKAIGLGFLLGIGGVVTFKNGGIDKFINQIDLKHIVLELIPLPSSCSFKENEMNLPIFMLLKNYQNYINFQREIASTTTNNAEKCFPLIRNSIFEIFSQRGNEWFKAHAWKVCIRQKRIEGSNPFLSAKLFFNLCAVISYNKLLYLIKYFEVLI